MTRLFIRFYLGVITVLLIAMAFLVYAFRYRLDTDYDSIAQKAMGGHVKLSRETVEATTSADAAAALEKLRGQLGYPVRVLSNDQIAEVVLQWLSKRDDVVVHASNELSVLTPLKTGTDALCFGPVPVAHKFETDLMVALCVMFFLVAIAIVILLQPLARQLSMLEHTAISIAEGNLGARVDLQRADSAKTLAKAFNDMAARTEALLRTQRELLQAVSHELRTPLARISFAIDLLRTARDDQERESRLKTLDTAAQEIEGLVGELLHYVRLETSLPQPAWEDIDLLPLAEELIEKHALVCEAIHFEVGPNLSHGTVRLVADRSGLLRVLSNLLANAGKFGRKRVVVDAHATEKGTTIDVDDDGMGIPASDRERVFEPFVRLEESGHGAGLGLALVKRIVANHCGSVTALPSPLGGCRIRTFWPVVSDPDDTAASSGNE